MNAGPYPTKTQFKALEVRVNSLGAAEVPRLRDSGPDILQAISASLRTQAVQQLFIRPSETLGVSTTSALRLQVPSGTTEVPLTMRVRVRYGNALFVEIPLFGEASIVQEAGTTWLSLPVRVDTSRYLTVHLEFGSAYPLVLTSDGNEAMRSLLVEAYGAAEADGPLGFGGAWLVTSGARTILGRLSPDALPFVDSPTLGNAFPDPGLEVVLADPPYLRLRLNGQEFKLPFTAESGGGSVS